MRIRASTRLIGAALLATSCANPFSPTRVVPISIQQLQLPVDVAAAGPLDGVAVAVIGGCITLNRVEALRNGNGIRVAAFGNDAGGPGIACTENIGYVPVSFSVAGPFAGSVVVMAVQPDGSVTSQTVPVR